MEAFEPETLANAKNVVLSPDPSNPYKFESETRTLVEVILNAGLITENSRVLDFGCGMGRIARELINTVGCKVIGLEQTTIMLNHAIEYVNSDNFQGTLEYPANNSVDVAISILALQHSEFPEKEINSIYDSLTPEGHLILVNESYRLIPVEINSDGWVIWYDDGLNIHSIITKQFNEIARSKKACGLDVILFEKVKK